MQRIQWTPGHGSIYPTRVSVADCRQHFDRFIDPHRSAMGARPAGQV
jgi:hypothetical protein